MQVAVAGVLCVVTSAHSGVYSLCCRITSRVPLHSLESARTLTSLLLCVSCCSTSAKLLLLGSAATEESKLMKQTFLTAKGYKRWLSVDTAWRYAGECPTYVTQASGMHRHHSGYCTTLLCKSTNQPTIATDQQCSHSGFGLLRKEAYVCL